MKKIEVTKTLFLAAAGMLLSSGMWAQAVKASPAATASGKVKGATITITYSSPAVKGRQIFGGLVPFDQVWRAGANEATLFETDKPVKIEGKALPAGKYSLYAIPGKLSWTMIFNAETGQWGIKRSGETTRDPAKDVISIKVKSVKVSTLKERLAYTVTSKGFTLGWENTEVPVSIR